MYSRREICATAALSSVMFAQSFNSAKSAPVMPLQSLPDHIILAQTFPPLPDFKTADEFKKVLITRFVNRAESRQTKVADDGVKAINDLIEKAMPLVFSPYKEGPMDKSKQYSSLPLPIRQVITIRNLDSMADTAISVAEEENKKLQKGKTITGAIIQGVRDFLCPMYPFCLG
jgi:hypothetical protein